MKRLNAMEKGMVRFTFSVCFYIFVWYMYIFLLEKKARLADRNWGIRKIYFVHSSQMKEENIF